MPKQATWPVEPRSEAAFPPVVPKTGEALPPDKAQSLEVLGRLVTGVAHDFNNLLTGIRLYCDLLMAALGEQALSDVNFDRSPERDRRLRHYGTEIRKASDHGSALTQQLMNMLRDEVSIPKVTSLNEAILGMRDLLGRLIGENIRLLTELDEHLEMTPVDPAQAQQIILNLVLNARDAMPDGGRITLTTRNHSVHFMNASIAKVGAEDFVEFSVADTGIGMDAETCSRAFEPFYTTKESGKGNGLGLATVRKIVIQHGGNIHVESEVKSGTRVVVQLPRVSAMSKSSRAPEKVRSK